MLTKRLGSDSPRSRTKYVVVPLLALVALFCWGLSSPIGSSPDDDFHLPSIWCGGASWTDGCKPAEESGQRRVSEDLFLNAHCYAGDATISASCQDEGFGEDLSAGLTSTTRGNFERLYPPVYYFAMSLFAGNDLQSSALVMRAVTSLIFVVLVTALFFLLPLGRRPTLMISLLVTLVPHGLFLIPSNNPSGWGIISAGALWIALLGYFETVGRRRAGLAAVALAATVMGAGARADGAVYAVIAVVAVLILKLEWNRQFLRSCALPLAVTVIAAVFFLTAQQSTTAATGMGAGSGENFGAYVLGVQNFLQMPFLMIGAFGIWGLGWIDTPMPAVVTLAGVGAYSALAMFGFGELWRRKSVAALFALAVLFAVPTYILYLSDLLVGQGVQPRYILPLMIVFVGIALIQPIGRVMVLTRGQVVILGTAVSIANAIALHTNIRRYVTGFDVADGNLDAGQEWWWDIPVSPMAVWTIGSLAFAAIVFLLARAWLAAMDRPTTEMVIPLTREQTLSR